MKSKYYAGVFKLKLATLFSTFAFTSGNFINLNISRMCSYYAIAYYV